MTLGTEFIIIILLWCGDPGGIHNFGGKLTPSVQQCRREKLECLSRLKNFSNDDVVNKCLMGVQK